MKIKHLFCMTDFAIDTALRPAEVREVLARHTGPRLVWKEPEIPRDFFGKVHERGFRIRPCFQSYIRSAARPVLLGEFAERDNGCRVRIVASLTMVTFLFMAVFIAGAALIGTGILSQVVAGAAPWYEAGYAFGMVALPYAFTHLLFWHDLRRTRELLNRILAARPPEGENT